MKRKTKRQPYRIAHFGDVHLEDAKQQLDELSMMVDDALEQRVDHIVFTGDILDEANAEILRSFVRILKLKGLMDADKLTVVPGNHDIYPLSWPPSLSGMWKTIFRESQRNFKRFVKATSMLRHGHCSEELQSNEPYPFGKELQHDVVLVGIDSTRSDSKSPFKWAGGELPEDDIGRAKNYFDKHKQANHRVMVMHHYPMDDFKEVSPFVPMKFDDPDAATARKRIAWSGANLLLCGHIHSNRQRKVKDRFQIVCTDSVNTYVDQDGDGGRQYNIVSLHPTGRVTVDQRIFSTQ